MAAHWNASCNVCKVTHFQYCRYKCLQCYNYNLCSDCYDNELIKSIHNPTHPYQCIMDRSALELYFAGEEIPDLFADSFTCPYCGLMGHTPKELVEHVWSKHCLDPTHVVCPLCVAMPTMRTTTMMPRLGLHLSFQHGKETLDRSDLESANENVNCNPSTPQSPPTPPPPPPPPPPAPPAPQLPSATLSDFFGDSLGSTISHDDDFDPDDFNVESSSLTLNDLNADLQRLNPIDTNDNSVE